MRYLIRSTSLIFFIIVNTSILYAQNDGAGDVYDPNQVRNDDLRYQPPAVITSKAERDKKLDEIVDKFEELRFREEALISKKDTLIKAQDKKGLEDLEDDFKDLASERAKVDKEMLKLKD